MRRTLCEEHLAANTGGTARLLGSYLDCVVLEHGRVGVGDVLHGDAVELSFVDIRYSVVFSSL